MIYYRTVSVEEILEEIRSASLALPGAYEKLSHGAPCFFIEKKGQFSFFVNDHHGDGRLALWLATPPGLQESLIEEDPSSYFRPPYVGVRGWIGVRLDRELDWQEVKDLIELAHSTISAKKR